jgi:predicted phosphodiesterase
MRIALVSDIHGNLAALEAVVADIRRRGVDRIVNLGDSLSGPLLPLETAQYLMATGWPSLAGNHERQIIEGKGPRIPSDEYAHSQLTHAEFDWIRSLVHRADLTPEIFLCHGTPASDIEYFLETLEDGIVRPASAREVDRRLGPVQSALVACGHTHVPRAVKSGRGQLIVNPGSVGLQAYDDIHPTPHIVQTGSPDARYAIVEEAADGWVAALLSVPYDYRSMARLARLRGRPEWEHALLTGYASDA